LKLGGALRAYELFMRPYLELTRSLTYICRGVPDAIFHIAWLRPSEILSSAEAAVPGSVRVDVLKVQVNEIGTAVVEFLTGCWPAPSGGIVARDIGLLGPATLRDVWVTLCCCFFLGVSFPSCLPSGDADRFLLLTRWAPRSLAPTGDSSGTCATP